MAGTNEQQAITAATESAEWAASKEHLKVEFERIVLAGDAAVASFTVGSNQRWIVPLEWNGREWDALGASIFDSQSRATRSVRPSEVRRSHWTVVAAGFAPLEATRAIVYFAGRDHEVPVVSGLYMFAAAVDRKPEDAPKLVRIE
jgi:hypothetical protein